MEHLPYLVYIVLPLIFVVVITAVILYLRHMKNKAREIGHGDAPNTPSEIVAELRADGAKIDSQTK
jgi:hypothetical protein